MVGTVKQCLFDSNLADFGGGIFRGSANGEISGNVFQNNRALRIGGAIYDSHAQVSPAHSTQHILVVVASCILSVLCSPTLRRMALHASLTMCYRSRLAWPIVCMG